MDVGPSLPNYIGQISIREKCPNCKAFSHFTLVACSHPSHNVEEIGSIYTCISCSCLIYITWKISSINGNSFQVDFPQKMHLSIPEVDMKYVSPDVNYEYNEALKCYGLECFSAFAAMCRRTIQAIFSDQKIDGTNKVQQQSRKFAEEYGDPEINEILEELIKTGSDGAHPHLPKVDKNRADIMLALMNDFLDQLYNRPGRIEEARALREKAIKGN